MHGGLAREKRCYQVAQATEPGPWRGQNYKPYLRKGLRNYTRKRCPLQPVAGCRLPTMIHKAVQQRQQALRDLLRRAQIAEPALLQLGRRMPAHANSESSPLVTALSQVGNSAGS